MNNIYTVSQKISKYLHISVGRMVIFINMVLWFVIGGATGYIIGLVAQLSLVDTALNCGAFLSIVIGYVGSAFWMLRNI